mmetsp:Transcript_8983/g.15417  ORF Transcript_8983/g.15417 Transcript_8983/m.15417 type:complete len:121 (+) Transcript_8983:66-428(+)|eukprot:CAMPEP_0196654268 /NCGR_PEP_ID=MMETSP1086-20130531/3981_1 /TAXON_ID=77921 /ORGANISM="Cyanoptyche  gloeocystis , Strain SAG4.97" /LENGTH=120 /DNA_ID=CAMNT_0041985937 /DNA_START=55 /DNA_END=417 /DNA_ORIENTATION=-
MSGGPGGTAARVNALPPEKGSFPLDHFGECRGAMREFLQCMQEHNNLESECRDKAKSYFKCRMELGLMAQQPFEDLGFTETAKPRNTASPDSFHRKEREGFVAGLRRVRPTQGPDLPNKP